MNFILVLVVAALGSVTASPTMADNADSKAGRDENPIGYVARRRHLLERLEEEREYEPVAEAHVLMELAELSVGEGLYIEAGSYASAASEADLPLELAARRDRLSSILAAIDPRSEVDRTTSVRREDFQLEPVYQAVAEARAGRGGQAMEIAKPALGLLDGIPAAQAGDVLPPLLAAAVQDEDWTAARSIADRFLDDPHLRNSSALSLHLGLIAQHHGEMVRAFDHFSEAAGQKDIWGHKARLALIELARTSGAIEPVEAEEMLRTAHSFWRGSAESLMTLKRLKDLLLERGDAVAALVVLAEILHGRDPEGEESIIARKEASELIKQYYASGISGETKLEAFLDGHRRIAGSFRFFEEFDRETERFADFFLSIGATAIAAEEYRLTFEYLDVTRTLGISDVHPKRLEALRLKEASARLAGGQVDRARALLTEPTEITDKELVRRHAELRGRFFERTGEPLQETSNEELARSVESIRVSARERLLAKDWQAARSDYLKLFRALGSDLPIEDVENLLLAVKRSGEDTLFDVLSEIFSQELELASQAPTDDLANERPDEPELRSSTARAVISGALQALENVDQISRAQE